MPFSSRYGDHLDLHSVPTRRSSDLDRLVGAPCLRHFRPLHCVDEELGQPSANERVIVDQQYFHETSSWIGSWAITRVPFPGRDSTRSLPPTSPTRRRNMSRPM